jgi:AraC family transcriptional regulator
MGKKARQTQFHRSQIGRAQRFIRLHLIESLTLTRIAREAGSSSYHFARLFQAYVGETPFEFIRRIRLVTALSMLQEDAESSITEIALGIGYDTPAAFNKAMRRGTNLTPSEFRNLGKESQNALIYDLSQPRYTREAKVNLTPEFETITRGTTHYLFLERRGPFAEVAPPLWGQLQPIVRRIEATKIREYLGLSGIDKSKPGEDAMIYQAGVALVDKPDALPAGTEYRAIKTGHYARFLLTGPYSQIWPAFDSIFKTLASKQIALRPEFCIENYLNDPQTTPEDALKTELLVPVE